MNSKGVAIRYGDVAPEAKENFVPTASESEFNTLAQLQQYNLNFPNYANPCELYSVVLDGTASAFPSVSENANLGLWSKQISQEDGSFQRPIVLELESAGQYTSQGLMLTFDTDNGIFANRLSIKWLRITDEGITPLSEIEFSPDSASFYCKNFVENYNKIVITFYSINMPQNRLKLRAIDYGTGTFFYGKELKNVRLIQELDPISSQIAINTADFTLDSKSNTEYSFQQKQPLSIYFNGKLRATTFVKKATRKSKRQWSIQSEDYIGLMDSSQFYGGIYTNKNATELLEEIFLTAKVPYHIDAVFGDKFVTGYIPYTTCRDALMQVAFAVQAVVDTSDSDVVKVFELENEIKQHIPLRRIGQSPTFDEDETVTGVEVTAHNYKAISEAVDIYDSEESGTGKNIFVKFREPLHDLSIENGEIVSYGTNYAIINANEGCVLKGDKYEHTTQTKRKNNPIVLASDAEKVLSIENATLVSHSNLDNVLERCYNWLVRTDTSKLKIIEGKHVQYSKNVKYGQKKYGSFKYQNSKNAVSYDEAVNVGDKITFDTEYLGIIEGTAIKQSFNLNGNIIVKDTVLK